MYLLIHNSKITFPVELPENFIQINIKEFYSLKDENDFLYRSNEDEFYLNSISESLDNSLYQNVKAVIIDKNIGSLGWTMAIRLAGHVVCSDYLKCAINRVPIIFTDWANIDIEDVTLKDSVINNIFQTTGFYFRKYEDLFSMKLNNLTGVLNYRIEEMTRLRPIDFDQLNIKSVYDNNHQAANEWGAMRLASNFGVFELIKFTYPKHLYFKYLSRFINKDHLAPNKSLHNLFSKILLIDDNADCGWIELLKNIHFEFDDLEKSFKGEIDKITSADILNVWKNVTPEKFDQYDLIYLDLYLEKGKADSTNAVSALKFIKENNPHIPVIIFTASDKAWNLDEVLEKGADAMYIKESPNYYDNKEYSLKNFKDFVATIKDVHDKYKILRPYWKLISQLISHTSFKSIENFPRKLGDRIEERLRMFYGLLKKGHEQREYDKLTFFYSDYELAFMTLWSILNEIQEAHYDKTYVSITHTNGVTYNHHPNPKKSPFSKKQKWILKSSEKTFINNTITFAGSESDGSPKLGNDGRFDLQADSNKATSDLKIDWNPPYYSIDSEGLFSENNYILKSLHAQIAYILLNRRSHENTHLTNLYKLNEIRNSMYLTHGDSFDSNFYTQTEKAKRNSSKITPSHDIKDLFDLVAYLLSEDPSNVINF
jgi:CheY-like chemotaxis protein